MSLEKVSWDGDALNGEKEAPREPVVRRQTLQWQISMLIGISGLERRVAGADMAPQRHVRCAEVVKVMVKCWIEAWGTSKSKLRRNWVLPYDILRTQY